MSLISIIQFSMLLKIIAQLNAIASRRLKKLELKPLFTAPHFNIVFGLGDCGQLYSKMLDRGNILIANSLDFEKEYHCRNATFIKRLRVLQ